MSVGLVVSFFNQINHDLTENNFCLLMASPAFEVPQGTAGFEVCEGRSQLHLVCDCVCVWECEREGERGGKSEQSFLCLLKVLKHNT